MGVRRTLPAVVRRTPPPAPLLEQFGEAPVLENSPAGLLFRAVIRLVLREVDGLDRGAAAGAGLALAFVDLERHRHLVRNLGADRLLVVVDRVAEDVEGGVEALDLLGVELGPFLERREPGLPEDLVDPGAADPGDVFLVAEQRVQVARLSIAAAKSASGGGGQASGPRPATISSSATASAGSSFAQARCLVPNSRSRSSRPSLSRTRTREALSFGEARLSKTRSRPADIKWISSARSPSSTTGILPTRRTPVTWRPASASSGGSKVFITFIPGASADSTSAPASAASRRRATISTSGSSGIVERLRRSPRRLSEPPVY